LEGGAFEVATTFVTFSIKGRYTEKWYFVDFFSFVVQATVVPSRGEKEK